MQFKEVPLQDDLLEVVQQRPGCENEEEIAITQWIAAEDIVDLVQSYGNPKEDEES